jgi:hypothetical protein
MPAAYNSTQKQAINTFCQATGADRSTAAKVSNHHQGVLLSISSKELTYLFSISRTTPGTPTKLLIGTVVTTHSTGKSIFS